MTLVSAKKGMALVISVLPQDSVRYQLMKIGINEGDRIICAQRLPGGTIVIRKKRQEIAIGSELARKIHIKPVKN